MDSIIKNVHVSFSTLYSLDVSHACKDVKLRITISLTIPDESMCWTKPIQVHADMELWYTRQDHGFVYLVGSNLIKAGKHYMSSKPLLRVDNQIKLPLYIQQLDAFI